MIEALMWIALIIMVVTSATAWILMGLALLKDRKTRKDFDKILKNLKNNEQYDRSEDKNGN